MGGLYRPLIPYPISPEKISEIILDTFNKLPHFVSDMNLTTTLVALTVFVIVAIITIPNENTEP